MATWVLAVLGADRPGLVDALSGAIERHGGNWERSEMARLGGRFAGIVEVSLPDSGADDLRSALLAIGAERGLHITIDDDSPAPALDGARFVLSLVGSDRPGLVHSVSSALAEIGASIDELTTETTNAPMSGDLLFEANAVVVLPPSLTVEAVRAQLEALADRLMVDIDFID